MALAVKLGMEVVALHKSPRVEAAPFNVELVTMRAGTQSYLTEQVYWMKFRFTDVQETGLLL